MITIGDFIDEVKEKDKMVNFFFLIWEQTAPICYGEDYRLEPLIEDFITHVLNEIEFFGHGCLEELKKRNDNSSLHQYMSETFSKALKTVIDITNNYIKYVEITHIEKAKILQVTQ